MRQPSRSMSWATIPETGAGHERVGLDASAPVGALAGGVVEGDDLVVAAGDGEGDQRRGIGQGAAAGELQRRDHVLDGGDPGSQRGRKDVLELGERSHCGLGHAGESDGGGAQRDRGGDGFVVVECERRERGPGGEPIAAGVTGPGVDQVADLPEPVDVATHGPHAHAEPVGELRARPLPPGLQQRQQAQGTSRQVVRHTPNLRRFEDVFCPQRFVRWWKTNDRGAE